MNCSRLWDSVSASASRLPTLRPKTKAHNLLALCRLGYAITKTGVLPERAWQFDLGHAKKPKI